MSSSDKINALKQQWAAAGLARQQLKDDPLEQFELWYQQAVESGIAEPNAMCLATVSQTAAPSQRTVLMKKVDREGLVFFTNYGSRKARQIDQNKQVSAIFPWIALHRQVSFEGSVERISNRESLSYFVTRERGSQLGAWTSVQSEVIQSRAVLKAKLDQIKRKFVAGQIPLPDFWGGFRLRPTRIEFWQGRAHRLHDRFIYIRSVDDDWSVQRLWP